MALTRTCKKCGASDWMPNGTSVRCRPCRVAQNKARASTQEFKEKQKERMAKLRTNPEYKQRELELRHAREDNPEHRQKERERFRKLRTDPEHKQKQREYQRKHYREAPWKNNAKAAQRRAVKLQATPVWADKEKIKEVYRQARKLSKEFGVEFQVDHIVPLQSDIVCGLHCWENLQLLEASLNKSKSNNL